VGVGEQKARLPGHKMFILGILAGVFIGFASHLATTVATGPFGPVQWLGLKKLLVGSVFSVGLMLVIIPGSELWTGNNLMGIALLHRRISLADLAKNWLLVYAGNFVGSLLLAVVVARLSGLLAGEVGATAIKIAAAKTSAAPVGDLGHNMAFFFRAVGCNWLVCLAVMMAVAAQDIAGKVLAIFFPIMAFVASGFEHCVANMYFIPAGIFAKVFDPAVAASGLSPDQLAGLNWGSMWTQNLLSVTAGNFVGGFVLVACLYYWMFVLGSEGKGS
jgi:formate/nitrite transporter